MQSIVLIKIIFLAALVKYSQFIVAVICSKWQFLCLQDCNFHVNDLKAIERDDVCFVAKMTADLSGELHQ